MTKTIARRPLDGTLDDGSELTNLVERIPELEDIIGIRLEGICAIREKFNAVGHTTIRVMAEVKSFIGHVLDGFVVIQVVVKNEHGKVVGVGGEHLFPTTYRGYQAINVSVECRDDPARIIVAPKG